MSEAFGQQVAEVINLQVERVAYNVNDDPEYIGWAVAGTATSSSGWRIKKFTYAGTNYTGSGFADGNTKPDNVWDDRASYSYS